MLDSKEYCLCLIFYQKDKNERNKDIILLYLNSIEKLLFIFWTLLLKKIPKSNNIYLIGYFL